MALSVEERIAQLQAAQASVSPTDTMAEAGRKVLLDETVTMLQHEAGSRTGEDIEDVHDMRVAIRRMRSTFRLLKPYFKAKDVRDFNRELQRIAWALGEVRDLDVLIHDLRAYQSLLATDDQVPLQAAIDELDRSRLAARDELNAALDSKRYRRFLKSFGQFLTTPIDESWANGSVIPTQVRHLLPGLIYERLSSVLAYDNVLDAADEPTLHALRIEFKRLRYAVSLFDVVLGSQVEAFITELKLIQDCLGGIQDTVAAHTRLDDLLEEEDPSGVLHKYVANLESRANELKAQFPALWKRFNSRKVQEKLSDSILALR